MDAVKSFNLELSGLYEVKPPISKAKMTSITKGAIKAIKFYKHVVQSVEKFIQKCKPEYKVPGLYVIDSIVRQSRHQFGADRDVFAPRFAKNMPQTFIHLFACPEEEKSKVIRVLNLWQKNQVFQPEVIQPLFDLADPNHPVYSQNAIQSNGLGNQTVGTLVKGSPAIQKSPAKGPQAAYADHHTGPINMNNLPDSNNFAQLQQLHKTLQKQGGDGVVVKVEGQAVRFDRKLLDFDYDDEEEEEQLQFINPSPGSQSHNTSANAMDTVGSLLSNPEVLRQLQTLQQSMSQSQQHYQEIDMEKLRRLQEMKQQEEEFDKHLAQTVANLPFASECDLKPMMNPPPPSMQPYYMTQENLGIPPPGFKAYPPYELTAIQEGRNVDLDVQSRVLREIPEVEVTNTVINLDQTDSRSPTPNEDRYTSRRRRSRSRERSRERERSGRGKDRERNRRSRRSRSRSHSRDRRRQRSRSRDRERNRDRERDRDKEDKDKDREKEKERRKRGLPPFKKDFLCVCSTTLWVGHISKLVHQEELSDAFGEYGEIVSIDLIPPRGCAFIAMHRRQDASKCLEKLKNHKLQGKAMTLAWAPGKGLKGKEFKDYWEVDLGASYIPFAKVKPDIDIELLEDGGMIDEDSMPDWLKEQIAEKTNSTMMAPLHVPLIPGIGRPSIPSLANLDTSQPPPMPGTPMLQPPPTLPLTMVNPFQLNLGMNLPPNLMPPNIPIGVPPPNMAPPSMIPNQLLGFPQGPPPGLLPPPIALSTPNKPPPMHKPMPPFPVMQMPPVFPDESMDIEMEDVNKMNKPSPLSDQLLASLGNNDDTLNLNAAINRLNAASVKTEDHESYVQNQDEEREWNDERDWNNERKTRFNNDRNRDHHDYRSRDRDSSNYRESHGRKESHDQRDRRNYKRVNRWERDDMDYNEKDFSKGHQDHENGLHSQELNEEHSVKTEPLVEDPRSQLEINDQNLFEKGDDINAFMNPEPPSDASLHQDGNQNVPENFSGNNDWQLNNENNGQGQIDAFEEHNDWQSNQGNDWDNNQTGEHQWNPPSLMDQNKFNIPVPDFDHDVPRGHFDFNRDNSRFPVHNERFRENSDFNAHNMESSEFRHEDSYGADEGFDRGGPMFGEPCDEGPMFGEPCDEGPMFDEFGGPDHHGRPRFGGPDQGRFGFGDRGRGFRGRDMRRGFGGFDRGKRGGPGFGGPPRSEFWPSRNMRGGEPFRGRGRGGPFNLRGPPGRGGRNFGGPRWNDGGDRNFPPRFDGPPDHFRGSKFEEHPRRGNYDDSRSRRRERDDRTDRRHYRRDHEEERQPREKRSRWGSSPRREEPHHEADISENIPNTVYTEAQAQESSEGNMGGGNSTPLHDEPQELTNDLPGNSDSTAVAAAEEQQQ